MNGDTLVPFTDPSGKMSPQEVNDQNIQNIIDAINGLQASVGNLLKTPTAEIANDGTSNRAVFGYAQGLQQWGMFTSKAGYDALTDSDPSHFTLNSSQDAFKIVGSGTINSQPANTFANAGQVGQNQSVISVAHGLPFTPAVIAYIFLGGAYVPLPYTFFSTNGTVQWQSDLFRIQTDGTNVSVIAQVFASAVGSGSGFAASTPSFPVKYYLLQETAN